MPPVLNEARGVVRPEAVLSPSAAGFTAYRRINGSRRQGLTWSTSGDTIPLPVTTPSGSDVRGFEALLATASDLMPALLGQMGRVLARKRRRGEERGDQEIPGVLASLSKHSWDIRSYLDGISEQDILAAIAGSGLTLPRPNSSTTSSSSSTPRNAAIDDFVLALAKWFKSTFMSWIDPISCPRCGGKTRGGASVAPSPSEQAEGGGRVELHQCEKPSCGAIRRFVRYGRVGPLLRTKEGRCGEWAHLFYAFLRVAGVEARYVWNSEDHVWAEYWSPIKQHWVHVDPCEAAVNKPLLYEQGWGKKQAFCIAVGPRGAEDVTAVYVADQEACLGRRRDKGWSERTLALALEQFTISLQLQAPSSDLPSWQDMLRKQHAWKADVDGRIEEAAREELGGRVSGPEEWRKMRDEMGHDAVIRPTYTIESELHNIRTSDVYLFGDASRSGSGVLLTSASSQTGAVFADISVPQSSSFRSTLDFRMTAPPGAGEADGMAIVFSRERRLGLGGYGLGYTGLGGKGDFAIEIDTYRTQDHADDPPTPHISVHSPPHAHHRHSIACTQPGQVPSLSDGQIRRLELLYDGRSRRLKGWLSRPDEGRSERVDEVDLWDISIPPPDAQEAVSDWYVGVTGSCGGLWQKQEVLEWSIQAIDISDAGPAAAVSDTEHI